MWTDEDNSFFFYNQVWYFFCQNKSLIRFLLTDYVYRRSLLACETRWRNYQALLDLDPRPICSNCSFYESKVECITYNKYICLRRCPFWRKACQSPVSMLV